MSDDRSILPIPDPTPEPSAILDAKDPAAVFPPIEPMRPPAEAPNVLVILLDDVGFAPPARGAAGTTEMPTSSWIQGS